MSGEAITRRDFLKYVAALVALYGIEGIDLRRLETALSSQSFKIPAVWISGLSCGGCSESFLSIDNPDVLEVLLNLIDLRYHELLVKDGNLESLSETDKRYILFVEGSIPAKESACLKDSASFFETLERLSQKSDFIIALGSCASFGGVPSLGFSKTVPLKQFTGRNDVINLSTCPVNPDHLALLLVFLFYYGKLPELDSLGRPKMFFSKKIHDYCERRNHFDEGRYLMDLNDSNQKDYCLCKLGCKGMYANADCSIRKWNGINSWCVSCNAGCQACSEKDFFITMAPFFEEKGEFPANRIFTKSTAIFAAGAATSLIFKKIYSTVTRRKGEEKT